MTFLLLYSVIAIREIRTTIRLMRGLILLATLACILSCHSEKNPTHGEAPSPPIAPPPTQTPPTAHIPPKNPLKAQFTGKLWRTSLGKMYEYFLFASYDRYDLPELAQNIVDKILVDPDQTIARVAAIQMMNEDLHIRGRVTEDVLARIAMLEQQMDKGWREVEVSTATRILEFVPFVFLAAIPLGSPLVRTEFSNLIKGYGMKVVAWVKRERAPPAPLIQWRQIASRQFFDGYDVRRPFDAFVKTGLPLAAYEWINMKRKLDGSSKGLAPNEIESAANFSR